MLDTVRPDRTVALARRGVLGAFALNGFLLANWITRVPSVRDGLHLSAGRLGVLLLALAAGSVLALPLVGSVVLRVGTRRTVLAAGLLVSASTVGIGLGVALGSLPLVAAALFGAGVGTGAWDVAMNIEGAAVERLVGRTIMPQFHAVFSLGAVVGSATGAVAALLGLSVLAHLVVVSAFVAAGVVTVTRVFLPAELSAVSAPAAQGGQATPGADALGEGRSRGAFGAWLEPRTLLIGLLVLSAALTEGAANDWLSLAVVDGFGRTEAVGAITFALFVAAMTAVRLFGNSLLDRYGRVAVLRVSAAVSLTGLLVFGLVPTFWVALLGVLAWGAGAALGFPVGMSAAADEPSRSAARVSVVSSIGYCAFLAGPPLLGLAADQFGLRYALMLIGIGLLLSLLISSAAAPLRPAVTGDAPERDGDGDEAEPLDVPVSAEALEAEPCR